MELQSLTAISPIDGRYHSQLNSLAKYFSEYGLIHYRVKVEIEYFIALSENNFFKLSSTNKKNLRAIYQAFTIDDAKAIKQIERTTNHDVKAVEYFIKERFKELGLEKISEWVHFGLTSQDINNTAVPMLWRDCLTNEYFILINQLIQHLHTLAKQWKNISMLARTHGQPASPTKLGKEIMVFVSRLKKQSQQLKSIEVTAKFGGATGNFNAHVVAYPSINWIKFADDFLKNYLQLKRQPFTTQIENYDDLAAQMDALKRINTILIDLCRDVWTYISMEYFKQKIKAGEVGSSAMPHKVNPIDFENAEGNLGMANALLEHLSSKLPVSRLQRDLTDSTVLRNIGVPLSHTMLAVYSIEKGLDKLLLNKTKIDEDLNNNWAVVAEALQTILRRENYPKPYEALKELTRKNEVVNKQSIQSFIQSLNVSEKIKKEMLAVTPQNYTGIHPSI